MQRSHVSGITAVLALAAVLAFPVAAAEENVAKAIFLFQEEDRIVASNAQTGQFFDLRFNAKEQVLDQYIANGAAIVVTNQRYAGIGSFSGGWQSIRRIAGEELVSAEVQDYSALLVTTDRLLSFSGRNGSWSQTKR
jgi:light-regulated signal transduction histidine kinase (bacteriophytochrome)